MIAASVLGASTAQAARAESFSQIWFNSNGDVVGQHAEFCNNVQYEGGSQTGAFSLVIHSGCGDQLRMCSEQGTQYVCTGYINNHALTAVVTGNSGGLTAGQLCELVQTCLGFEVELMNGYGFSMLQIYP